MSEIAPHGGKLVNRLVKESERAKLLDEAKRLKTVHLHAREISDLEMIATGVFSPLEGFLTKKDYDGVVANNHLSTGEAWTIPITLSVSKDEAANLKGATKAALLGANDEPIAIIYIEDIYEYDKKKEAQAVYKTQDEAHPGVKYLYSQGDYLVGGKIALITRPAHEDFLEYRMDPVKTREVFKAKGWRRIVGFQTRNPIHRAHEYIIKSALEIVDGLFLNPLVGETKEGDIPAKTRMDCYNALAEKYFPKERVVIGVYGAAMRYAGPKEAILHAIVRKNFGCTHFIVGRDHAGVGNYYGTFDAQKIFDDFKHGELGITPLFFDHSFYCRHCGGMATSKTCPHPAEEHFALSGTKVRELLNAGEVPPEEFTRPEVADILIDWYREERK